MNRIIDFLKFTIEEAGAASVMMIPIYAGSICGVFYCICWCIHHFFILPFVQ